MEFHVKSLFFHAIWDFLRTCNASSPVLDSVNIVASEIRTDTTLSSQSEAAPILTSSPAFSSHQAISFSTENGGGTIGHRGSAPAN